MLSPGIVRYGRDESMWISHGDEELTRAGILLRRYEGLENYQTHTTTSLRSRRCMSMHDGKFKGDSTASYDNLSTIR